MKALKLIVGVAEVGVIVFMIGGRVLVKVVLARGLACVFILGGPTSTSMSSLCRLDIQADLILTSVEKTNLSEFVHISQAVRP